MCAINPLHKKRIIFDFYTSHQMTKEKFDDFVLAWSLQQEQLCNEYGHIRLHIKETDQEAE